MIKLDSYGDLWRVHDDHLVLLPTCEEQSGWKFEWKSVPKDCVMRACIRTHQTSCPNVFVDVELEQNGKIVYSYTSESRWHTFTSITWLHEESGKIYTVENQDEECGEIELASVENITKRLEKEGIEVEDYCNMLNA